jgi:Skp family chaperone for outer membrane proteins
VEEAAAGLFSSQNLALSRRRGVGMIPPHSDSGAAVIGCPMARPRTIPMRVRSASQGVLHVSRKHLGYAIAAVMVAAMATAHGQPGGRPVAGGPPAAGAAAPAAAVRPAAPAGVAPTQVVVLDVGYIFKNHAGFNAEMAKIKEDVMNVENRLKQEQERIKQMVDQLKAYQPGTPEYRKLEGDVAKAQGDFQVKAQLEKKDFLEREAKVYHRVYGEVEQAVSTFAKSNRIAVVLRFDGEAVDPKEADRGKIMAHLSRPIVYHDGLVDITPDVLRMLNGPIAAQPQRQPLR